MTVPVFGQSAEPPRRVPFRLAYLLRDGSRGEQEFTAFAVVDSRTLYAVTSQDDTVRAAAMLSMVESLLVDDDGVSAHATPTHDPGGRWSISGADRHPSAEAASSDADTCGSSLRRWRRLMDGDSDAVIELATLSAVTAWLLEQAGDRPTQPPQVSSPSWPTAADSAVTYVAGSPSLVSPG